MRNVYLSIFFAVFAPFLFLFALIFTLTIYRQNYLSDLLTLKNTNSVAYAALPTNQNTFSGEIEQKNGRTEKIRQFLHKYGSPLEPYTQDIIEASQQYDIDYRLVPAIAMQESNLCLKIPVNSNNCWGFGIYGGKVHYFESYKEGIYAVSKTLGTKYKSRGLITPEQIMTMWTPSSNGSWAFSVNHFMEKMN